MSNRNPTHGQKVDLGQNAPVKHEGPGEVPKESLAKESIKEGGEFSHNEGIQGENQPPSGHEGTSAGHHSKSSGLEKASTGHSTSHSTNKSSESKASAGHTTKKSSGLDKTSTDHSTKKSAGSENTSTSRATSKASAPGSDSKSSGGDHGHTYADAASGPHGENLKAPMGESNTDGLQKALASEPGSMDDPSRVAERQFQEHNNAVGREAGPKQTKIESETTFDPLKAETSS